MKIPIENVIINEEERIRRDPGDITSLEASIRKVGLLNPILVDEENRLIAGFRRLQACRAIGWEEIEATVLPFGADPLKMLDAEVDENLFRKDFTPEEVASIEERRQEILRRLRGNIFQRFWHWLKNLFCCRKRSAEEASASETQPEPPVTFDFRETQDTPKPTETAGTPGPSADHEPSGEKIEEPVPPVSP